MRQVTAALAKAAEQGIVHRDIKPENIMLTASGEVKVADFGLARISGEGDSLNLTQTGMTMGTPLYMSPEQVEGKPLDARSDIYSLGVTCYQMLCGQPPFRGETALSVAVQHIKTLPERLENRRTDLPPALGRIVHKMLAKDPNDRYASPRDLLRDLRALEIDGVTGEWPADLDERNITEMAALGHSPLDGTRRLDAVMKTQALAIHNNRRWIRRLAAATAAAFLVGGGAAIALRPPFLLNVPASETASATVEKKNSALEQYLYAVEVGTEAAWKSVARYFPANKVYVPRAQQQLARFYLQHDRYEEALALFQDFANYDDVESKYRAFGLAGQCVVYSLEGKQQESIAKGLKLSELAGGLTPEKLDKLLDRQMVQLVGHVLRKDLIANNKQTAADWDKWQEQHFHDEAPGQ